MSLNDQAVLLFSPFVLFDIWVQVVVPSIEKEMFKAPNCGLPFSALLSNPARECCSYLAPVVRPIFLYHVNQSLVLLVSPWTFHHGWVKDLLPPVKTLNVSSIVKERGYTFPILCLKYQ
jgi:hypothetical protein